MTPKEIRLDIVERLTGSTVAGDRVYGNRMNPVKPPTSSSLFIFTTSRKGVNVDHVNPTFTVDVDVEINAVVPMGGTWEDDVDDFLEEIKTVLFGDSEFVDDFLDTSPEYDEEILLNNDAERKLATGVLTFTVRTWIDY